ncbi:MAG: class I SAM-dependent methyltransferase [Bacteroidetes bacterium]|nr:class I SAM-dependent methyltransferase [Bacteroidota bacterium]
MSLSREFDPTLLSPVYLIRRRLLEKIRQYASSLEGELLDFGCGAKPYQSLFQVKSYTGVDYDGPGHSHEKESIDYFYDGVSLPFPNDRFDSIFTSEVFEHIFNLPQILPELYRVLRPGGRMLITCPFAYCEHEVPNDYARYTSFAMRAILENAGFRILALDKSGNAVETVWQLRIVYWQQFILSRLASIPIVRKLARDLIYGSFNLSALLSSRLLPTSQNLYLNNVVLVEKPERS